MRYTSTRDNNIDISSAEAIIKGISEDNGLFVPKEIPQLPINTLTADFYRQKSDADRYSLLAAEIFELYFNDFDIDYLRESAQKAYSVSFEMSPAPLKYLGGPLCVLELFHGPTLAFKDMALQVMPYLFVEAKRMLNDSSHTLILVATSGDTGTAALEGYRDIKGTNIFVYYPFNGVSDIQRLQMCTQQGSNVYAVGIMGNFDDTQRAVKSIMTDRILAGELNKSGIKLSSANSINIARLIPQIVYYYSTYLTLCRDGKIAEGDKINFTVPSGNFGDILAGYYAMQMGLPINKLICASNVNRVLTDFINTGEYNLKRDFFTSISPSMDILLSSNIERLIWNITGRSDRGTAELYSSLLETGRFCLTEAETGLLKESFTAYSCDDAETMNSIRSVYNSCGYVVDPHTAVAFGAYDKHISNTGDMTFNVIIATASPYKFCDSVLKALGADNGTDAGSFARLEQLSKTVTPEPLKDIESKDVRFNESIPLGCEEAFIKRYIKTIKVT